MNGSHAARDITAKANELYWGSELSVNQIADELDLSKGALYGMLLPEKSGSWCPECGADVGFDNRTAKDRGQLSCLECGWEGDLADAEAFGGEGAVTLPPHAEDALAPAGETALTEQPELAVAADGGQGVAGILDSSRGRIAAGGALLGAAAGLALVLWARRR